jgi:peptide/nickel transport system substrate-binding protein
MAILLGCGGGAVRDPRVFRYNESAGLQSLDPAHARTLEPMWVVDQLFDGLVELAADLSIQPSVARTWWWEDGGRRAVFVLREDAWFAPTPGLPGLERGRRVVAQDVVYSLNRLRDPEVASSGGWILEPLDFDAPGAGMEALGADTVVFHLKEPFPPFFGLLATAYANVVAPEAVAHFGRDFRSHPVGSGPFKLKWWVEDVACVLHANERYWERDEAGRKLPYLEAVHIDFAADMGAEFQGLIQGRYDFMSGLHAAYLEELLTAVGELNGAYSGQIRLETIPFLKTDYIGILVDPHLPASAGHPLLDPRVRRALSLATDRTAIATHLRRGAVLPTERFTPPTLPGMPPYAPPTFDLDSARALLASAGHPNGTGIPPLTLSTTSDYTDLAAALQHQWRALGLEVAIDVLSPGTQRERVAQGEALLFRKSWLADYPDAENFLGLFLQRNFAPAGPNYTHYANDAFDALYAEALGTDDDSTRLAAYATMDALVAHDLPVIPLFHDRVTHFVRNDVQGWTIHPVNRLDLRRVHKAPLH